MKKMCGIISKKQFRSLVVDAIEAAILFAWVAGTILAASWALKICGVL